MVSPSNMIGLASVRDLGVGSGIGDMSRMTDQATQEELRKRKAMMDQRANGGAVAPFTGAFMSLTGNQY